MVKALNGIHWHSTSNIAAIVVHEFSCFVQVAVNEARLGSIDEVIECTKSADVLKPAKAAAVELLQIMTGSDDTANRYVHCEEDQ